METWAERYVDQQVDRAWLDLRLDLAERFAAGLASGEMDPLDITTPSGETLTVVVDDEHVTVFAGDETYATENVDEAAYTVFQVLHEEWQVVHPCFLESEAVDVPEVEVPATAPAVPVLGMAESREQLQSWVHATFQEDASEPLRIARDGRIYWRTKGGGRVGVGARNAVRVELSAVVARDVSFKKAREVIDDLADKLFAIKFSLVQDTLVMTQVVIANPYAGDQVRNALGAFCNDLDKLSEWVPEQVLRKRVRRERDQVAKAEEARAAAQQAAERAEAAEVTAKAERDAARRELELMKRRLSRVIGLSSRPVPDQLTLEDID